MVGICASFLNQYEAFSQDTTKKRTYYISGVTLALIIKNGTFLHRLFVCVTVDIYINDY
jgi:hypothetical protein